MTTDPAVVMKPLASLKPYERNSRTHSAEQVAQIAESIKKFGFTNPILVDGEGTIVAGHGRLEAAKALGIDSVPVIVLSQLTPELRRQYVIADNKIALNGGWNIEILRDELKQIKIDDPTLGLTGFSADEFKEFLLPVDDRPKGRREITVTNKHIVMIECGTETEQAELFTELKGRGFTATIME